MNTAISTTPADEKPVPTAPYLPPNEGFVPPYHVYPSINEHYTPQGPPPPYSANNGFDHAAGVCPNSMPTTVIVKETTFMSMLGSKPTCMNCPRCHKDVITSTEHSAGLLTWLLVGGLFLFGFVAGCCLIPFCVNGCRDVVHFCPNCSLEIGRYKRL